MTKDQGTNRYFSSGLYRVLSAIFGLFLIGVGIFTVVFGVVVPLYRISLGVLIAVLGAQALWSAIRSKPSWLSQLGPFP